jgi:hypothetical protein
VIGRMKTSWRIFAGGRPGLRFRERYRLRRMRGHRALHPARLAYVAGGATLVVVSAFFGWMPVLGWGTAVLGMAMISGEVLAVAQLMDRAEVAAKRLWAPAGRALARLPSRMRLAVSLALALSSFVLTYVILVLALGA